MHDSECTPTGRSGRFGVYAAFVSGAKFGMIVGVAVLLVRSFAGT